MIRKFFCFCLCCMFLSSFFLLGYSKNDLSGKKECSDGSESSIVAGWKKFKRKTTGRSTEIRRGDNGSTNNDVVAYHGGVGKGDLFGIAAKYKKQTPEQIYLKLIGSFYSGNLHNGFFSENYFSGKVEYYERHLDIALGYTWAFNEDKTLLSPFASLNFLYDTAYFAGYNTHRKHKLSKKWAYRGFIGMLGLDVKHTFTNCFEAGFIIAIGLPLYVSAKFLELMYVGSIANPDITLLTQDAATEKLCFEAVVPIRYIKDNWKFGLDFSYSRKSLHAPFEKANLESYGIAGTIICVF